MRATPKALQCHHEASALVYSMLSANGKASTGVPKRNANTASPPAAASGTNACPMRGFVFSSFKVEGGPLGSFSLSLSPPWSVS
eukprot:7339703-Prymnesium_polylepis.2